jgi:hypothetical protein
LAEQGVALEGTILKVSMVLAGKEAAVQSTEQEVAQQTVKCLKENVPANIAGVVFLSGGQSDSASTVHLNLMHQLGEALPWPLSFSYGRGIQQPHSKRGLRTELILPAHESFWYEWLAAEEKYSASEKLLTLFYASRISSAKKCAHVPCGSDH